MIIVFLSAKTLSDGGLSSLPAEELSSSGQLCVRTKAGLVPMLDFLKQHGYAKPLG